VRLQLAGVVTLVPLLAVADDLRPAGGDGTAHVSVYLDDAITAENRGKVDRTLASAAIVATRESVSKDAALQRFQRDFPALAGAAAGLGENPLPASIEVKLNPDADTAALDRLATEIAALPGVADVRYDRQWIERVLTTVLLVRGIGVLLALVLVVAGCLTVANVVRLALVARLEEVRIMALVGAPLAYLRGPFVVEGILQGGLGAVVAVVGLYLAFLAVLARFGEMVSTLAGPQSVGFLSLNLAALLVAAGMAVGCIGGLVAARSARALATEG